MKKVLGFVGIMSALLLVGACGLPGGDDGDDGGGTPTPSGSPTPTPGGNNLTAGTYNVGNLQIGQNGCNLNFSGLDGAQITVSVNGNTVDAGGIVLTNDGNGNLSSVVEEDWDWNTQDPPFDCVEHDIYTYTGTITTATSFTLTMAINWTPTSGDFAKCEEANGGITMPCDSDASMSLASQ